MNGIERGILGDTIQTIKKLVNFAIQESANNNYLPDVQYKKTRYLLEIGQDTIEELEKVINGVCRAKRIRRKQ